eukprot:524597_1
MSHLLSPSDFNRTVKPLKQFYGDRDVQGAIDSLIQFYKDEAFDNEDISHITNDWVPGDFENCDGIDQFVDSLNYGSPVNSLQNKQVLFNWFCHWLLPNVAQPSSQPQRPIAHPDPPPNDNINTIANEFSLQLSIKIGTFQNRPELTSKIAGTFVQFCTDERYLQIEDFVSDLEGEIDGSFIMDGIIKKYPEYEHIKEEMFGVLYDIVEMMRYDNYPPFDLSYVTYLEILYRYLDMYHV